MHRDMGAMHQQHVQEMKAQVEKMRATLEQMKSNLAKVKDPALKQQSQFDVSTMAHRSGRTCDRQS
jgi:phage shock protein A